MQADLPVMLAKVQYLEESGATEEARSCYESLLEQFGQDNPIVPFQTAGFLFRTGDYAAALELYVHCHKAKFMCSDIEQIIMGAYYQPNEMVFQKQYNENVIAFCGSDDCKFDSFPDFSALVYRFIPYSESRYAVFDSSVGNFLFDIDFSPRANGKVKEEPTVYLLKNEFSVNEIGKYLNVQFTGDASEYVAASFPLYLVYESRERFVEFLQVSPFSSIIRDKRAIFLFGIDQVSKYFAQQDILFPIFYVNMKDAREPIFQCVEKLRQKMFAAGSVDYQNLLLFLKKDFS
ncbi:hypothetical protein ACUUL3_10790 [Thiovibrio sp. JS02]